MAHRGDRTAHFKVVSDHSEPNRDVLIGVTELLELNPDFFELDIGLAFLGLRAETS